MCGHIIYKSANKCRYRLDVGGKSIDGIMIHGILPKKTEYMGPAMYRKCVIWKTNIMEAHRQFPLYRNLLSSL